MISDEAVEAAAIALYEHKHIEGVGLADVRRALEAAAPYIAAEAWDGAVSEGESSGWLHDYAADDLRKRNPHRRQA